LQRSKLPLDTGLQTLT